MRNNPGVKFRLVRAVHAICPSCGRTYKYVEKERTFVVQQRNVGVQPADDAGAAGVPRRTRPPPGGGA
jgi:hypothetical protein